MENMDDLLKQYDAKVKPGDIISGEVVSIPDDKTAYIDIQAFTEGTLHLDHYTKNANITSLKDVLKVGDKIKVKVSKIKEESIYLSCLDIVDEKILEELNELFLQSENINVTVTKELKGIGWNVDYKGVTLFMHKSQATRDVQLGKKIDVKILKIESNDKRTNIVVSRYEVEKENYDKNRENEYESINVNDVLDGTVFKVEKYGALIKFNYVMGLLVPNQLSYKFVDITKELKPGDKIKVIVIKKENGKIDLSHKLLTDSPFKAYIKDKKVGDKVSGSVTEMLDFGALIKLNDDVNGFLHQTEYSHNPQEKFTNLKVGDVVETEIILIDEDKKKISLSRKKLLPNPWENKSFNVGDVIEVNIDEINQKGLKVSVDGITGLISAYDASIDDKDLSATYNVGDKVKAAVVEFKPKNWRLRLSIKKVYDSKIKKELEEQNQNVEDITIGDVIK